MSKSLTRVLPLGLVAAVAIAFLAAGWLGSPRESVAAPGAKVSIAFLYITGEGPSARAWYDGVPSPGVGVQDALDRFAKQGYRVARMSDNLRSTEDNVAYTILLERVAP